MVGPVPRSSGIGKALSCVSERRPPIPRLTAWFSFPGYGIEPTDFFRTFRSMPEHRLSLPEMTLVFEDPSRPRCRPVCRRYGSTRTRIPPVGQRFPPKYIRPSLTPLVKDRASEERPRALRVNFVQSGLGDLIQSSVRPEAGPFCFCRERRSSVRKLAGGEVNALQHAMPVLGACFNSRRRSVHKARLFRLHVRFPDSSYEKTHYVTPRRSSIMIKKTVPRAALFLPGAIEWRRSPRVRRIPPARLADTLSNDIPRN